MSKCSVKDCLKSSDRRGMCHMHYKRVLLTGEIGPIKGKKPSGRGNYTIEDALSFHGWTEDSITGCWIWQGSIHKTGYGCFVHRGKQYLAHRAIYESRIEPINNLHVLHVCDNRPCVNPNHLFLGTNNDNVQDKISKGRQIWGEKISTAKLTYEAVEYIRGEGSTERNKDLAEWFGVDPSVISKVRNGHRWIDPKTKI